MAEDLGNGVSRTLSASVLCSKCGQPGEFRPRHRQCRTCERETKRIWNLENPERLVRYREANRERYRKLNVAIARRKKAERHAWLDAFKNRPCADCGRSFPSYVMDMDHRDPSLKKYEISHLVNKTSAPWSRVLAEIQKCDVVCVCCHRLRTWVPPKHRGNQQRLVTCLKGEHCADCGEQWHYCQLDFDHVRGEKLGCVPHMGTVSAIKAEAAKCDVVCANCHRVRSHKFPKGETRHDPEDLDMVWKRQGKGLQTILESRPAPVPYHMKSDPPEPRSWHALAGTMSDKEVARNGGVSKAMVCMYRKRVGIPSHRSTSPSDASWHGLVGTMPDGKLATFVGVGRNTVVRHRKAFNLNTFTRGVKHG